MQASSVQEALDAANQGDDGPYSCNVIRLPEEYQQDPTPSFRVILLGPHTLP